MLGKRSQRGPLAVQRPFYPEGPVCHAYVLHPPGGVVGGDQLTLDATVDPAASALLTTPGATKFYRSNGQQASQQQHFRVTGGVLEWLPQENIFFPGGNSVLSTDIHLDAAARYIGWEIHCLGRPVIQEPFAPGRLLSRTRLYRERQPRFIDRLTIGGGQDLRGAAGLRQQPVIATLLATPAGRDVLAGVQPLCATPLAHGQAGATLLHDVLVVRYLGASTAEAHHLFRHIWHHIRPLVTGRAAVAPRIWNT